MLQGIHLSLSEWVPFLSDGDCPSKDRKGIDHTQWYYIFSQYVVSYMMEQCIQDEVDKYNKEHM